MPPSGRLFRPQLLRSLARRTPFQQRRTLHDLPPAHPHDHVFSQSGIDGLMSPEAYQLAWTRYQALMLDKVNKLTAGEPIQDLPLGDLVVGVSREPKFAHVFNYASMAWNNDFFFKGISPQSDMPCPPKLTDDLLATFHSFDNLKDTLLTAADTMFGPGYVWLVYQRFAPSTMLPGKWRVLSTYLSGSPLPDAHWRQQSTNMAIQSPSSLKGINMTKEAALRLQQQQHQEVQNSAGSFGPHSAVAKKVRERAPGGADVTPVLCVNTWEHVWLLDYDVSGKMHYLDNWWRKIDWNRVAALSPNRREQGLN